MTAEYHRLQGQFAQRPNEGVRPRTVRPTTVESQSSCRITLLWIKAPARWARTSASGPVRPAGRAEPAGRPYWLPCMPRRRCCCPSLGHGPLIARTSVGRQGSSTLAAAQISLDLGQPSPLNAAGACRLGSRILDTRLHPRCGLRTSRGRRRAGWHPPEPFRHSSLDLGHGRQCTPGSARPGCFGQPRVVKDLHDLGRGHHPRSPIGSAVGTGHVPWPLTGQRRLRPPAHRRGQPPRTDAAADARTTVGARGVRADPPLLSRIARTGRGTDL
jgi:hypothetical protein